MNRPEKFRQVIPVGRPLPLLIDCKPHVSPSNSRFNTTSWSLVTAAAGASTTTAQEALEVLCQTYWRPVFAFVRRSGVDQDQAKDLTQGFFAVLLEKNYLATAQQERGRFRSFLLTAVKHFLSSERDRTQAQHRALRATLQARGRGGQLPEGLPHLRQVIFTRAREHRGTPAAFE